VGKKKGELKKADTFRLESGTLRGEKGLELIYINQTAGERARKCGKRFRGGSWEEKCFCTLGGGAHGEKSKNKSEEWGT